MGLFLREVEIQGQPERQKHWLLMLFRGSENNFLSVKERKKEVERSGTREKERKSETKIGREGM